MKTESSQVNTHKEMLDFLDPARKLSPPILVVGMHNSGTSMLTEILHESGIFFQANMKHHESHFFTSFINDRLIMGGGDNWAKLPLMTIDEVLSYQDSVGPIIHTHWLADYIQWGYDGSSPWGIKDPRLCVLLPLYLKLFPGTRVVHIRRNPEDVAASLSGKYKAGVGVLDNFDHWKTLTEAYTQRVLELSEICPAYFELSYEDFCRDPEPLTRDLFAFLDLPFSEKTPQLLLKVTPARIGSYQRMMESKKHPTWNKIKSWLASLFR